MALSIPTGVLFLALFLAVALEGSDDGLCGMTQEELYKCKPAVAGGSAAPPPPSPDCCTALTHANITCFCGFKNNKYLPYLGINVTRAILLPSICDPKQSAQCSGNN